MKRLFLAALAVGLLVAADEPKKDRAKKEATALEGTWVVVSATQDGNEMEVPKDWLLVFKGKTVTLNRDKSWFLPIGIFVPVDFQIGPIYPQFRIIKGKLVPIPFNTKSKPVDKKDFTFKIDFKKGKVEGEVYNKKGDIESTFKIDPKKKTIDVTKPGVTWPIKGIYSLKGQELKVCIGETRPKDLTCKKGSGRFLVVLKRVHIDEKELKPVHINEKELGPVEGWVTLNGKPLANATVVFVPVDKKGQKATGTTNKNGEYKLTTHGKKGALSGKYKVIITKDIQGNPVLPARYRSEKTTPFEATVVAKGQNTVDFKLQRER
jgi:uncharacterized protein (TIGR03067 family)